MTLQEWLLAILAMIALSGYGDLFEVLITDESKHFLLGSLAGLLAFGLMWITLSVPGSIISQLRRRPISSGVACGTLIFCLLLAVSFALLSHYFLDYTVVLWDMPLDGIGDLDLIIP